MRFAIAGGTGMTGTQVEAVARERGHEVVLLSRGNGVDLVSGAGLHGRLDGVDAVIDVSNITTAKPDVSVSFFAGATTQLLAAERAAGVTHHLALTIVGAQAAPDGYYAGKLAQERLVERGDVPWTIQRTTQFHEYAGMMYHRTHAGAHIAPTGRVQPVALREVAVRLVDLAEGGAVGRATDMGGPQEESLADLVRRYAHAIGHRGALPVIDMPGALGRAFRSGALLPGPDALRGTQTFSEWLVALPDA
jgi:uncharacterized protein YbjT (DUF2867 family)